jgi:hypothetical protein
MPVTFEQENLLAESKALLLRLEKEKIETFSDRDMRLILAYQMWADGMVWKNVQYLLKSKDPFWDREKILDYCKNVFGL